MTDVQQQPMTLAARRRKFNREASEAEAAHTKAVEAAEKQYLEATADAETMFNDAIKDFRAEFEKSVKPFKDQRAKALAEAEAAYKREMAAAAQRAGFGG